MHHMSKTNIKDYMLCERIQYIHVEGASLANARLKLNKCYHVTGNLATNKYQCINQVAI